ncbi:MAG TPA: tetratricopeptide repeat protein [Chitinophagaceae bacterium]
MERFFLIALLSTSLFHGTSVAQFSHKIDSLMTIYNTAASDSDKVVACGKLAEYYYIYQLDKQGDSVLQEQLKIAEISQNKNLFFTAFFGNAIMNISSWGRKETFDRALQFVNEGLDYSKITGREDYVILSYIRIATLYRKKAELDKAFYNANIALTSSLNIKNDSIKILAAIELGDTYQAKGESLLAFKTYTTAFDNAVDADNIFLQSEVYHRFSELYISLQNILEAKEYLLRSVTLNKKYKNGEGLVKDYIDLARLTDERFYIEKALSLSDSLNLEYYYIRAKGLMFGYYTVIVKNSDSTLNFLNNNPDLNQTYINIGMPFYYMNIGSVYHYANKWDSAVYYLQLAQPGFEKDFNERNRKALYEEIGECYSNLQNTRMAISYYEKALALKTQINSPAKAAAYSDVLSTLYGQIGDYQKAFYYSRQGALLKDSLQKLASQKDIALIELGNEEKRHEKELQAIAAQKLVKRNLQYMAITVFITVIFFFLIVLGMFPISKVTIKLLGYFAFISLFEFIVLLIDPFLHDLTHGQPLQIWLIKIVLIALLVPLQHFLEHKTISYLHSRKKKYTFSIKKWWQNQKKPTEATIDGIEEDTAVL